MAKKVVADFKKDTEKDYVKLVKMIKGKKGAYQFIEKMVKKEDVDKYLNG